MYYSERELEGKRRALWWNSDKVIHCPMSVTFPIDGVQTGRGGQRGRESKSKNGI